MLWFWHIFRWGIWIREVELFVPYQRRKCFCSLKEDLRCLSQLWANPSWCCQSIAEVFILFTVHFLHCYSFIIFDTSHPPKRNEVTEKENKLNGRESIWSYSRKTCPKVLHFYASLHLWYQGENKMDGRKEEKNLITYLHFDLWIYIA